MRRLAVGLVAGIVVMLGLAGCSPSVKPVPPDPGVTAVVVSGVEVSAQEFRYCVKQVRAEVMDTAAKNRWTTNGSAPVSEDPTAELLVERASRKCAEGVIRRVQAADVGVIDDVTFDALTARWEADNRARAEAADAGKVVYGPVERSLEQYEFQEMADAASVVEREAADAMLAAPRALEKALADHPEVAKGLDLSKPAERLIAAKMIARDNFEVELRQALRDADVRFEDEWLRSVTLDSLVDPP
ncbi:hypothetical protein [Microlunatus sp. GCM10028923]|uniref:hypothetical protein n=1 Tax=Microlunatus sp. GCM10028923 TaxID=3273400 RepID=UPI00360FB9DA